MSNIIDGTAEFQAVDARAAAIFDLIYPVGAVFATTGSAPTRGTWEEIAQGRTLQGADSSHAVGTTIEAGLPNVTGAIGQIGSVSGQNWGLSMRNGNLQGAFTLYNDLGSNTAIKFSNTNNLEGDTGGANATFDASRSNPIYGNSSTVQPPAYVVHFYRRIA